MTCLRRAAPAIWFLVLIWVSANETAAYEFKLIPSLALRGEYDENLFFSSDDEEDDYIATISPGLRLTERTERVKVDLSGRADWIEYRDNDELDDVDQDYRGNFRYLITPEIGISADAMFTMDSRRDRDIDVTGLVMTNVERKRQYYSLSGDYTVSEKTASVLSYTYARDKFDDPEFVDMEMHRTALGFTHDLGRSFPLAVGRMNLGYARYDYENIELDDYSLTFGVARRFSELLSLLVDLGGRYTRSDIERVSDDKDDEWSGVGQVDLSYNHEVTRVSLSLSQYMRPASGRGGTSERTSASFDINTHFTAGLWGDIYTAYYLNKADAEEFGTLDIDEETWLIRPRVRYNFNRDMSLSASYQYTTVNYRESDTEAHRNLVFIRFYYQYPLFDK